MIGAAAGDLVAANLDVSNTWGTMALMVFVGLLVFWGTSLIEKVLAGWSFLLYATYLVFVLCYVWRYGGELTGNLSQVIVGEHWLLGSIKYVGYSVAVIPVILFCVKHMQCRRDAIFAGLLAGPLAMFPALLFFLAMAATYPAILSASVPADFMMQRLDIPWLKVFFYIVIFGTFVETGTAFIHVVNERLNDVYSEKNRTMPGWLRPLVAMVLLLISIVLATKIGLIDLISKGYGTLTRLFVLIFILPLLTLGLRKIALSSSRPAPNMPIAESTK